jgi:hypothetical protein
MAKIKKYEKAIPALMNENISMKRVIKDYGEK